MTRDEALKAFRNSTPNPASFSDEAWIDRFVALGMLKLTRPKSIEERAQEALQGVGYSASQAQTVVSQLRFLGFFLTEDSRP